MSTTATVPSRVSFLALLVAAAAAVAQALEFTAGHLQSGPDSQGSSFVSSSFVDRASQTLHIVGTTYGRWWTHDGNTDASSGTNDPACFYAVAQLPVDGQVAALDWLHSELLGVPSVEEGCLDLFMDMSTKRAYIVGHSGTDNTGLLGEFFNSGGPIAAEIGQVGMILDYSFQSDKGPTDEKPFQLLGGRMIQQERINRPVALAGFPGTDVLYVASMFSEFTSLSNEWEQGEQMDPAEYQKYGKNYFMNIKKYVAVSNPNSNGQLQRSVNPGIAGVFEAANKLPVFVTALLQLDDRLLVAGFTKGTGPGFTGPGHDADVGNTWDGFVTQLGLNDIAPMGSSPTYRVKSGRDDFVTDLCYSQQSPEHVFVTGFSKGHVGNHTATTNSNENPQSVRGFAMKLNLLDMTAVWVQEFEATPKSGVDRFNVRAISCTLTHDGKNLYVAGNVYHAGYMNLDLTLPESFGMNDVWVAQIGSQDGSSLDGKVVFVKQFGSSQDETVAYRGGIQVDENGNAILIGNTRGQIYRSRGSTEDQDHADVFMAMFERDTGEFMIPLDHSNFVSLPPKATLPPSPPTTPSPASAPTPPPQQESSAADDVSSGSGWIFMLLLLLLGVLAVVLMICYWNCYRIPRRDIATDRAKVLDYLQDFDVEDVELKHSATGGWHCAYVNDLAHGINRQATDDGGYSGGRFGRGDDGNSAYDPLTAGSAGSVGSGSFGSGRRVPRKSGSRASRGERERFTDDLLSVPNDDEEVVTFGTARDSRRDRRANYDGLVSAYRDSERAKKKAAGNINSSRHSASSNSSLSSSSSSRRNRAKERWENREII